MHTIKEAVVIKLKQKWKYLEETISNFKEEDEDSLVTLALLKTVMHVHKVLASDNAVLFSDICYSSPGYYAGAGNLTVLHVVNNGFVSKLSCMQPCVYSCNKYE